MDKFSVDRIENGFAVIEYNGSFIEISLENLPENVREGSILKKNSDGSFCVDIAETEKRKTLLFNKQNSLFDS